MKGKFLIALTVFSLFSGLVSAGELIFCESLNEKMEPVKPATEFKCNTISAIFNNDAPIGELNVIGSIYKVGDKKSEQLMDRSEVQIDPKWNVLYFADLELPDGTYRFSFSKTDGTALGEGTVKLTGDKPVKEISKNMIKEQVRGTTLKEIFKKYESLAK